MREIRTYGLMRGCWAARDAAAGWGLLDRITRIEIPRSAEPA